MRTKTPGFDNSSGSGPEFGPDPFEDSVSVSAWMYGRPTFFSAPGHGPGVPAHGHSFEPPPALPPLPPIVLPEEAMEAIAAVASSGITVGGTSAATVIGNSAGLTINLIWDAAAQGAPASFRAGITQAAQLLSAAITDKITVNLTIDYSGTGGGAAAGPDGGQYVAYSTVRSWLVNNASAGDTAFTTLPTGTSIQGQSSVVVWNSQLKLMGLLGANDTTTDDGSATFATDIAPSLLVGVALHELTHAMGRVPYGPQPDIFDLFRFTGVGTRLFSGSIPAAASYLSIDNGVTKIADIGKNSDPSDFLNSGVQGGNDPFNEYYSGSTLQTLTAADLKQLDVLGWHLAGATSTTPPPTTPPAATIIESFGATSLAQVGSNYWLYAKGTTTGPELFYNKSPVSSGQFGTWSPVAAEIVGNGYEIVFKDSATGNFTVWSADSSGNYITNLIGAVAGTSGTFEQFETVFQQDLNGDGKVGIVGTIVESTGATVLEQVSENYFLLAKATTAGPALQYNSAPVTTGQFGTWSPVAAEAVGSGYDIAWKDSASGQFTIWHTDANGNFISNLTGAVSGTSAALQQYETLFQQDLNADGTIGVAGTVIESSGATSLKQVASNYFLLTKLTGTGPELFYNQAPVTSGQFGTWSPVGAEAVGSGYEVAFKDSVSGQFTIWSTDANGNYLSNLTGALSGGSAALQQFESVFQQDLNGDGKIGVVGTIVEAAGATTLELVSSNYYLFAKNTTSGPLLQYNHSAVTAGQFGTWSPIAAEAVGSGYDVAWKDSATGQYTIWSVGANGDYLAHLTGAVSGTNATLQQFETVFQQDLNGDGTIGPLAATKLFAAPVQTSSVPPPPPPETNGGMPLQHVGYHAQQTSAENFQFTPVPVGSQHHAGFPAALPDLPPEHLEHPPAEFGSMPPPQPDHQAWDVHHWASSEEHLSHGVSHGWLTFA